MIFSASDCDSHAHGSDGTVWVCTTAAVVAAAFVIAPANAGAVADGLRPQLAHNTTIMSKRVLVVAMVIPE